jgi:2-desacetyl-2-hydroxyethyl bacteriochlorophyllide A dehydrogenase
MQLINALVCAQPGTLEVTRRPAPQPDAGFALVRPRRVGICGTDFHIFEGKHPYLQYPRVMGHELAVEVIAAPADSEVSPGEICVVNPYLSCGHCVACRVGKPNCCVDISVLGVHQDGGMADLLSLPVVNLIRAPGLTVDECATVEFLSIGAHAVRRGAVTSRDRVLVVGAGPIGLGVTVFAHLAGAEVTVFDRDEERTAVARSISGADVLTDMVAATDAFDVVFDATGNHQSMEKSFDFVAHGGRYVLVSVIKGSITFGDPDFHRKEMTLHGSRNATNEDFQRVIEAIRDGNVPIDRLVTHRTTLEGAARDIPRWATNKFGFIKALINIS